MTVIGYLRIEEGLKTDVSSRQSHSSHEKNKKTDVGEGGREIGRLKLEIITSEVLKLNFSLCKFINSAKNCIGF